MNSDYLTFALSYFYNTRRFSIYITMKIMHGGSSIKHIGDENGGF